MKRLFSVTLLSVALAFGAPVIRTGGVYNAASYIPLAMSTAGIAQGSYFVIFGSGLGPANIAIAPSLNFTTSVGGTTVTVTPTAGGPSIQCYLYYAVDGQVSAILPSNSRTGPATLTVTYNGATSEPAEISVVPTNFGIFTVNRQGSGPAAIQNISGAIADLNSLSRPAAAGQIMTLFGTGLGPISGSDSVPPGPVSPANLDVHVLIGGQSVPVLYAGRAPQFPGLDQINFQLPPTTPDGCFIPLAVQVNAIISNYATFAKAPAGGQCTTDLPATALQRLDSGGKITLGQLSLARSTLSASILGFALNITTDLVGGVFTALDTNALYNLNQTPGALPPLNPPGTCFVQTINSISPPASTVPPVAAALNAGALTLTGPKNKTQTLDFTAGSGYLKGLAQAGLPFAGLSLPGVPTVPAGSPETYLEPGQWSIINRAGPDIGPFSASITVPAPLTCTNCDKITTVDRTKPLKIDWTGGGGDKDYVQVVGTATTPLLADASQNVAVVFSCSTKASDGTLTVPVEILKQLPTSSDNLLDVNSGALVIINGLGLANGAFTAPLIASGNLDLGYFGYTSVLLKVVGYN